MLCIHCDIDAILVFGSDGRNGQDRQHPKHAPSAAPLTLGEHLEPNSQMELVGHSIVRPFSLSHTHIYIHIKAFMNLLHVSVLVPAFFYPLNVYEFALVLSLTEEEILLLTFQVLTAYPYSDPQYSGIMTSYGPQTMVCSEYLVLW